MQNLPDKFIDWYQSLEYVPANKGPAKGTIALSIVVLSRLTEDFSLDFEAHAAKRGAQIKGAGGTALATILKTFGEERPFSKEGGRTNRGGPSEVRLLLKALAELHLETYDEQARNNILQQMQLFLVDRIRDYHNRQKLKLTFNPALTTWYIIHNLLQLASSEGKAGFVAQHLVGAKLQLRFKDIVISNESANTADMQTNRPGDFLIGTTAFHITVAPMQPVFEKCKDNISQGLQPFLLVPDNKLIGARQNADQMIEQQIAVESIESFVSQNINEIGVFNKASLILNVKELINIYNKRVDEVETDKSLMIELPSNLQ